MKRYLLFSGAHYYAEGGWNDYRGSFDGKEDATAAYGAWRDLPENCHTRVWWQVVDTQTLKIIESGEEDLPY